MQPSALTIVIPAVLVQAATQRTRSLVGMTRPGRASLGSMGTAYRQKVIIANFAGTLSSLAGSLHASDP